MRQFIFIYMIFILSIAGFKAYPQGGLSSDKLKAQVENTLQSVSRIRGDKPPEKYKVEIVGKEVLLNHIHEAMEKELTPELRMIDSWGLVAFKVFPTPFDSGKFMKDFAGDQVAGFYDPNKDALFLMTWLPESMIIPVIAHELTHLLQDQQKDLYSYIHVQDQSLDQAHSRHAVAEGEASLVMTLMAEEQNHQQGSLTKQSGPPFFLGNLEVEKKKMAEKFKVPVEIIETSLFSYEAGYPFVKALWEKGGFSRVKFAYDCPPHGTKEIIYVEDYLSRSQGGKCREALAFKPIQGLTKYFKEQKDPTPLFSDQGVHGLNLLLQFHLGMKTAPVWVRSYVGDRTFILVRKEKPPIAGMMMELQLKTEPDAKQAYRDLGLMTRKVVGAPQSDKESSFNDDSASYRWVHPKEQGHYLVMREKNAVFIGWNLTSRMANDIKGIVAGSSLSN